MADEPQVIPEGRELRPRLARRIQLRSRYHATYPFFRSLKGRNRAPPYPLPATRQSAPAGSSTKPVPGPARPAAHRAARGSPPR